VNLQASVIIPAYDSSGTIRVCLEGVLNQTLPRDSYEVIVVDDASHDDTAAIAERYGVKVVRQAHGGPAVARNLGARCAQGDILVFTDSDCAPTEEWLIRMLRPFRNDQAVVGAKGVYRTSQRELTARFVQLEYEDKYRRMARQRYIDFVDTYSAAYRREVFLQNGGFDESFPFPSVEDQEFSFRLARKGYRMVFVPDAVVAHHHDKDLGEYWERKFRTGYWKAYMLRWLPEKILSDSHTPASQRLQIALLTLSLGLALSALAFPILLLAGLASAAAFFASALQFLGNIRARDPQVLLVAPLLLVLRAAALGAGLVMGAVSAPSIQQQTKAGPSLIFFIVKRGLDILGASVGLLLSAPVMLAAGIAIKATSSGPIFFTQERAGENGKPFHVVKLRTMVEGAHLQVQDVLAANPLSGPVFKIPNDPRVTPVGRFLRRWSLDELPQFWNVLMGEMSLVGPRPEETWVVEQYDDYNRQRLAVKPGLTGPMQVAGRGTLDMDARLSLELEYIQRYSLWQDIKILLKTIPAILSGRGAM